MATIWLTNYQQKMAQRYDRNVRAREFCAGNLVLCRVVRSTKDSNAGKLASN